MLAVFFNCVMNELGCFLLRERDDFFVVVLRGLLVHSKIPDSRGRLEYRPIAGVFFFFFRYWFGNPCRTLIVTRRWLKRLPDGQMLLEQQ
jgi:hypothetical protein